MAFIRQGTCNRCGQCCGADGSPNQANPFPRNWPEALRHWSLDDAVNELCPQLGMFGFGNLGDEIGVAPENRVGFYRVGGRKKPYVWITGEGCCKDTSPQNNGSSYSLECPFLEPTDGDPNNIRPCALIGTQDDGAYKKFCDPEGPVQFETQASLDQWETDHPECSHYWVEE